MNHTNIEWVKNPDGSQGYTWNPITGCLNGCPYCYARKLANGRLRYQYLANSCLPTHDEPNHEQHHEDPFYPRFWGSRLGDFGKPDSYGSQNVRHPKGIFVSDMGELFGNLIPRNWQDIIFNYIKDYPEHRFYLLTKQPQNLIRFSPFPDNCWVGVTATNQETFIDALMEISKVEAKVKYISFEPLLVGMNGGECEGNRLDGLIEAGINWVIIGACTGTKSDLIELNKRYPQLALMPWGKKWTAQPPIEWVREIVTAASRASIRVFLKNNLKPLYCKTYDKPGQEYGLRQEMPL